MEGTTVRMGLRAAVAMLVACLAVLLSIAGAGAGVVMRSDAEAQQRTAERKSELQKLYDTLAALPAIDSGRSTNGTRRALVIGNNDYENISRLNKAEGDAKSIGGALKTLGFETTILENLDRDGFDDALDAFYDTLKEGDLTVFYFSGHGLAYEGENYLLPVDVPMLDPDDGRKLRREAVDASEIAAEIRNRNVELALIVLDACRDSPFQREDTKSAMRLGGLARMEPQRGMFVIYSAGVGQQALDRLGPADSDANSVFTRKFMPILTTPGLPLVDIAKRTQVEVRALAEKADHRQEPAYYDQVVGQTYFQPPAPRLFGIAIGVDTYVDYKLRGAANDAERVARAIEALGAEKVVRMVEADARVEFLDYVWNDMIADARPGDTIVFAYAGSSAQIKAPQGSPEADGLDELLLLSGASAAEMQQAGVIDPGSMILDDELTRWMEMAADKNVNVVLLVDGCYGGGLLDRQFANVSFLGASAEDEVVLEYEIEGVIHGLASVAFAMGLEGLADLNKDGFVTQRELFLHVSAEVFTIAGLKQTPHYLPDLAAGATDMPLFSVPADIERRVAEIEARHSALQIATQPAE
jgi:hypothetical protein